MVDKSKHMYSWKNKVSNVVELGKRIATSNKARPQRSNQSFDDFRYVANEIKLNKPKNKRRPKRISAR